MGDTRIIGDFLLSKNFENFSFRRGYNFSLFNIKTEKLSAPGNIFLSLLNNYELIIEVLENNKSKIQEPYWNVPNFIEKNLLKHDKFIAKFISTGIENFICENNSTLSHLQKDLKEIESVINEVKKDKEYDLVEEMEEDKSEIIDELKKYKDRSKNLEEYISKLILTFTNYKTYLDLYFGILDNKKFKKQDLSYFQSFFMLEFDIPKHKMSQFFIENSQITLANNMLLSCYKNLKEKTKKEHLSDDEIYSELFEMNKNLLKNNEIFTLRNYEIYSLKDLFCVFFNYLLENNITINKCKNCSKYFIPANRTDEKYCENISPQNSHKTCKEIGSKLSFAYKRDSEPISREHNRTKVALSMRISRAKKKNDFEEVNKVSKHLKKYLSNYQKKLNNYNKHKISEEELINWIISQKEI